MEFQQQVANILLLRWVMFSKALGQVFRLACLCFIGATFPVML